MMTRIQQQGFTLLELVLAIAIFAVVSVLTYSGLNSVIQTSQVMEQQADALRQLQLAMIFVQRDVMQMAPRQINEGNGQLQAAIKINRDNAILEFTRDGHPNPANTLRSTLQRVRYVLDESEEKWYRLSWNRIDHTQNEAPQKQLLLSEITALNFRFLNVQKQWQNTWQPERVAGQKIEIPSAIEMNIEHKRWGKIQRLFVIKQ